MKSRQPANRFDEISNEYDLRRAKALSMGGPEKLRAREQKGQLNARSRIDWLVDPASFYESGLFAQSVDPENRRPRRRDRLQRLHG
jgi:acetyl-CoA carboxylase carboxyltransferase component